MLGRSGTGIVIKRGGGRGTEALVLVGVNGYPAGVDGPGSEVDEWWVTDPNTWGARGGGTYSYGGAGSVLNEGVVVNAGAGAVSLEGGRVDLCTGGGRFGWGEGYDW